jgi:hypothetical protein
MVREQTPAVTATEWSSSNVILTPLHRVGQHQHKIQAANMLELKINAACNMSDNIANGCPQTVDNRQTVCGFWS